MGAASGGASAAAEENARKDPPTHPKAEMRAPSACFAIAALLTSCADHVVYQQDVSVPEGAWHRDFTPEFTFTVTDTVSRHDLFIDLRHTGDYPFSDLFLFIDLAGPDGRSLRDTVECLLADPTGRWYGKGTGFILAKRTEITAKVLYKYRNRFPVAGPYTIRLEQAMRTETLPGVIDVGVSVERSR
jgi:gliding motility-associated lipoprotein GldH